MKLLCYALSDFAPKLRAAQPQRRWMDEFTDRHAYRCLPLAIANAHGWEALCPVPIEITWNGGEAISDLKIRALKPLPDGRPLDQFCRSNFARGIVTFHVDYLFRTEPEWDLLATGPFNRPKDNAYPLTGIMEADWLPYPFTMNWQVLHPGRVLFEQDEPFCFFFPIRKQALVGCEPEIRRLNDDAELSRQHGAFRAARDEFMVRHRAGDPAAIQEAWQRHYFVGRHPDGTKVDGHILKLRLEEPVDRRPLPVPGNELPRPTTNSPPTRGIDTRWEDHSVLNAITTTQDENNILGRQRLDSQGHLAGGSRTCQVKSSDQAQGRDFVINNDLLTAKECDTLCQAFAALEHRLFKSDAIDPYWNNRFIWFADIAAARPAAGQIMLDALRRANQRMTEFYRLRAPIYADLLQIVRWQPGMFMLPHADNANPDDSEHRMGYRDFSGVFYLNDDYEGGELYFTALDVAVKPRRGMFLGFTGGFHHEHTVLRVQSGTRLTMPIFFTFDASKADRMLLEDLTARREGLVDWFAGIGRRWMTAARE
jgi:hypothetical protein